MCQDLLTLFFYLDGEDGAVKIWSRTGMLRSVLAQNGKIKYIYLTADNFCIVRYKIMYYIYDYKYMSIHFIYLSIL